MTAYLIVDVAIRDPQRYEDYKQKVPALIARHGGEYLVRCGGTTLQVVRYNAGQVAVVADGTAVSLRPAVEAATLLAGAPR